MFERYRIEKKKKRVFNYALFLFLASLSFPSFSQSKVQIIARDNQQPIFLSHVKFTCLSGREQGRFKWMVSDQNGFAINPFPDTSRVDISFIGFENKSITLFPNETRKISLTTSAFGLMNWLFLHILFLLKFKNPFMRLKQLVKQK